MIWGHPYFWKHPDLSKANDDLPKRLSGSFSVPLRFMASSFKCFSRKIPRIHRGTWRNASLGTMPPFPAEKPPGKGHTQFFGGESMNLWHKNTPLFGDVWDFWTINKKSASQIWWKKNPPKKLAARQLEEEKKNVSIGFLRGGCPRGGGNWGTVRIPREDWGTLGNPIKISTSDVFLMFQHVSTFNERKLLNKKHQNKFHDMWLANPKSCDITPMAPIASYEPKKWKWPLKQH